MEAVGATVGAGMTAAVQMDMHGSQMRLDPLTVCLAILVGGLLRLADLSVQRTQRPRPGHDLVVPVDGT